MMYHLRKDIECPKCHHVDFKIEEHTEQFPEHERDGITYKKDDVFLIWWEVYCVHCDETVVRIDK